MIASNKTNCYIEEVTEQTQGSPAWIKAGATTVTIKPKLIPVVVNGNNLEAVMPLGDTSHAGSRVNILDRSGITDAIVPSEVKANAPVVTLLETVTPVDAFEGYVALAAAGNVLAISERMNDEGTLTYGRIRCMAGIGGTNVIEELVIKDPSNPIPNDFGKNVALSSSGLYLLAYRFYDENIEGGGTVRHRVVDLYGFNLKGWNGNGSDVSMPDLLASPILYTNFTPTGESFEYGTSLAVNSDGTIILISDGFDLFIRYRNVWRDDWSTDIRFHDPGNGLISNVAISGDGMTMAYVADGATVRIWTLASREQGHGDDLYPIMNLEWLDNDFSLYLSNNTDMRISLNNDGTLLAVYLQGFNDVTIYQKNVNGTWSTYTYITHGLDTSKFIDISLETEILNRRTKLAVVEGRDAVTDGLIKIFLIEGGVDTVDPVTEEITLPDVTIDNFEWPIYTAADNRVVVFPIYDQVTSANILKLGLRDTDTGTVTMLNDILTSPSINFYNETVALSENGLTLAVHYDGAGTTIVVFKRATIADDFVEASDLAPVDMIGNDPAPYISSMTISSDGNMIIVRANSTLLVYVWNNDASLWALTQSKYMAQLFDGRAE